MKEDKILGYLPTLCKAYLHYSFNELKAGISDSSSPRFAQYNTAEEQNQGISLHLVVCPCFNTESTSEKLEFWASQTGRH